MNADSAGRQTQLYRITRRMTAFPWQEALVMGRKKVSDAAVQPHELSGSQMAGLIARHAECVGDFAVEVQNMSAGLGLKQLQLDQTLLESLDRTVLRSLPHLPARLQTTLSKPGEPLTLSDATLLLLTLARTMLDGDPNRQLANVLVSSQLMSNVQLGMAKTLIPPDLEQSRAEPLTDVIFQFKITLLRIQPPVWRRIQVPDGTLQDLHYAIQDAMGWTNSHLYEFVIAGERYCNTEFETGDYDDDAPADSLSILLSELLPEGKKKFRFKYTYDFGDDWEHEILYEGSRLRERRQTYPLCVEGARACPPEDIGGVWGYLEYLKALADPQHERHAEFMEWSSHFDPERFDPAEATQAMHGGTCES
jgi:hypothetical protein